MDYNVPLSGIAALSVCLVAFAFWYHKIRNPFSHLTGASPNLDRVDLKESGFQHMLYSLE
jgi:hypothetical protein